MPGSINKVVVKLKGLSHTDSDDLDILPVGPGGQKSCSYPMPVGQPMG